VPPFTPSKPPPPFLEPTLSVATQHKAKGALDDALEAYRKAINIAPDAEPAVLAALHADMGGILRNQGKLREATAQYDKALGILPSHKRSLEALIELALERKDYVRVVSLRRKVVGFTDEAKAKALELTRIAQHLAQDLGEVRNAIEALELARGLRPDDIAPLETLRLLYGRSGEWKKVIDIVGELSRKVTDKSQRARLRVEQAEVAIGRLHDETRGIAHLEAALEEDVNYEAAMRMVIELRKKRREFQELDIFYTKVIDRFAQAGRAERAGFFCRQLALLRRDELDDTEGAIDAFSGALRCRPADHESRADLAQLFVSTGDSIAAIHELEEMAARDPRSQRPYRKLFEIHTREGRTDRAWLAAMALEELEAAELDHALIAKQYRSDGVLRAVNALTDADWDKFLRAPGYDPTVGQIFRVIAPSAVGARIDAMRKERKLFALDPSKWQDPQGTASIVRTFVWAADVLGIALPDLYTLDEVPGGLAAVQVDPPATAIGPPVAKGLSVQQMAFLAGRHLTYYRPENYSLVFYPTLAEVTTLFMAALRMVVSDMTVPSGSLELVAQLEDDLHLRMTPEEKEELADCVKSFQGAGGRIDLPAFMRSVELTAGRAGLVLCGDLAVATRTFRAEKRSIAELRASDRVSDLLAFCASEKLAVLREWLGVTARDSMLPPALL
jgi:tetratricopeptide (TPR) repeat protein